MSPSVLLMLFFFAGPVIWAVYISMTNTALTGPFAAQPAWVGLDNFQRALGDEAVHSAIKRTFIFTVACVAGQNLVGLLLAFLLQHRNRVVRVLVSVVVLGAWVVPEIVAAFVWYTFLQPTGGTLNQMLEFVGLPVQAWLISAPLLSVILANVWRGSAFCMLLYSAALQDVPGDVMEAALVDGASWWSRAWHVVLPTIRRTIAATLLITTLGTLGVFGLIWAMTAGGPADQSQTLPILMYQKAFTYSLLGYGSAIALVLLCIGALFAIFYVRLLRTEDA